jgi:hypothetical protein
LLFIELLWQIAQRLSRHIFKRGGTSTSHLPKPSIVNPKHPTDGFIAQHRGDALAFE